MIQNLHKFYDTDTRTVIESINGINNPFWIDTLRAWPELNQINTTVTLEKFLTMPLWKTPLIHSIRALGCISTF